MAYAITGVSWEDIQKHHQDEIFTIGMIALNYGLLENVFRRIFSAVTGLQAAQVSAIFERLPNNHRQSALTQLLEQSAMSEELDGEVKYFAEAFKTLAA